MFLNYDNLMLANSNSHLFSSLFTLVVLGYLIPGQYSVIVYCNEINII